MQPCSIVDIDWWSDIARAIDLRGVWIASQPGALYRRSEPRQAAVSPGRLYGNDSYLVRALSTQQQYADLGPVATTSAVTVGMIAIGYAVNVLGVSTRSTSSAAGFDLLWGRGGVAGTQSFRVGANSNPSESSTHSGLSGSVAYHYIGAWDAAQEGGRVRLLVDGAWDAGAGGQRTTSVTHSQNLMFARRGTTYWTGYAELIYWGLARAADPAVYAELSADPYKALVRQRPQRRYSLPPMQSDAGSVGNVSASAGSRGAGTAAVSAVVALAAVEISAPTATAATSAHVPLSATALAVTRSAGAFSASVTVSAEAVAQAAAATGASAEILLRAAAAARTAGRAAVAASFEVAASASASTTAQADPAASVPVSASGTAHTAGTAAPAAGDVGAVSASATAATHGAAVVVVSVRLAVAAGTSGGAAGELHADVAVTAAGLAATAATGSLVIAIPIAASAVAAGHASATVRGVDATVLISDPRYLVCAAGTPYRADAPARAYRAEAPARAYRVT